MNDKRHDKRHGKGSSQGGRFAASGRAQEVTPASPLRLDCSQSPVRADGSWEVRVPPTIIAARDYGPSAVQENLYKVPVGDDGDEVTLAVDASTHKATDVCVDTPTGDGDLRCVVNIQDGVVRRASFGGWADDEQVLGVSAEMVEGRLHYNVNGEPQQGNVHVSTVCDESGQLVALTAQADHHSATIDVENGKIVAVTTENDSKRVSIIKEGGDVGLHVEDGGGAVGYKFERPQSPDGLGVLVGASTSEDAHLGRIHRERSLLKEGNPPR